jgi:hypothetical protein
MQYLPYSVPCTESMKAQHWPVSIHKLPRAERQWSVHGYNGPHSCWSKDNDDPFSARTVHLSHMHFNEATPGTSLSARFQVLMAARMEMTAFWDTVLHSLKVDRCFRGAYSLPCWWWQYAPLKHWSTSTRLHSAISQKAVIFLRLTSLSFSIKVTQCTN